jgi:hypothetical protein
VLSININIKIIIFVILIIGILSENKNTQTPQLLPGFGRYIDSSAAPSFNGGTPIAADFNRDGFKEILFALYAGSGYSRVYIINHLGQNLNSNWPKQFYTLSFFSTAAGDVNGDGYIDVVLRSRDTLYVLNYLGQNLPGFPYYAPSTQVSKLSLYDLNNDGKLEIITTINNNQVIVIKSNGTILEGWPVTLAGTDPNSIYTPEFSVGDINNDVIPEIVLPHSHCPPPNYECDINYINVFKTNGEYLSGWPVATDSAYNYSNALTTLLPKGINNDVKIILNSTYFPCLYCDAYTRTSSYSYNGILLNRFITTTFYYTGQVIPIDTDGNGIFEYCFGTRPLPIFIYNTSGQLMPGWPQIGNGYFLNTPLIVKLTQNFNIISFQTHADTVGGYNEVHGYLRAYELNGNPLPWSPLRPIGGVVTPLFSDINNDGNVDMIVLTNGPIFPFSALIYAWTFPGVLFSYEDFPWPQFGHDRYRTKQYGFIPPDEVIGIKPMSSNIPQRFKLYQNYPNPFNPNTSIKFDISQKTFVQLIVYDVLGRELETLVSEELKAGEYQLTWQAAKYASGIYFCKLITQDYTQTRKMVLVR